MGVGFYLKNPHALHRTVIRLHYRKQSLNVRVSTGISIPPAAWDRKRQRMRRASSTSLEHNSTLDRIEFDALQATEDIPGQASAESIQRTLTRIVQSHGSHQSSSRLRKPSTELVDVLDRWLHAGRESRSPSTIKVWTTLRNHIESFQKDKTLAIHEMDQEWYDGFVRYLRHDVGLCDVTIWRNVRTWKLFCRWCEKQRIPINQCYLSASKSEFKVRTSHAVRLTVDQLQRMANSRMPSVPGIDNARRLFLLQCCLGTRYQDLCRIVENPCDFIRGELIILRTQKTDEAVAIPLLPLARDLLFGDPPLYAVCNQKYNRSLKLAAERAGLTDIVIRTRWYGSRVLRERVRMCELLSSHAAKRTFVTIMARLGVRTETIMRITGNSRATIDAYLHLDEHDVLAETISKAAETFSGF